LPLRDLLEPRQMKYSKAREEVNVVIIMIFILRIRTNKKAKKQPFYLQYFRF
jgi:hypothetical protein